MIVEEGEIPVYVSPATTKKKPEVAPEIDYYEKKQPRQKVAEPGAGLVTHLVCSCDDEVSLCGLDMRAVEGEGDNDISEGMCIVCVKYDESAYHTCPLCGRF